MMEPLELLVWRKQHRYTQTRLASVLGVQRQTIAAWEAGKHRTPIDLLNRLTALAAPASGPQMPERLNVLTAKARPDLRLYERPVRAGEQIRGREHPAYLVPHLKPPEGVVWPWTILEHPDYLAALARHRAAPPPSFTDAYYPQKGE